MRIEESDETYNGFKKCTYMDDSEKHDMMTCEYADDDMLHDGGSACPKVSKEEGYAGCDVE
ncbi:hypothetical protein BDR06DRAFT_1005107 [Suillus hirtellus]|nr:hypothetical protein BDR06DRAFT_1005107 [Suillus hirtellus]